MGKQQANDVVQLSQQDGVAFIENNTELTRLHYFDGKFLRADAFAEEQDYHRARNRLSNLAGGWGVVHGFSLSSSGDALIVGAGFALTAAGNMVLAHEDMQAKINDLIKIAAPAPVSGHAEFADCFNAPAAEAKTSNGLRIYEISVGPVEGLCGNEAVYGKLCESACASDSQHPYWREGVVLRLRPISLQLPTSSSVTLGNVHLRNRVASAYFATEPWLSANALSAAGLSSNVWCNPASVYGRDEVVIGLLLREGETNHLIDAWSARRERIDSQAKSYWQGRMAMRPWNVFIAQILQFQCQLSRLFADDNITLKPDGNCDDIRALLKQTRKELEALHKKYSESSARILQQFGEKPSKKQVESFASEVKISSHELYELSSSLSSAHLGSAVLPQNRLLLNRGFVELPPAGYLPVSPHNIGVEAQCARLFGEGVQLHYHAVRADEIAHLVEEAQHLQRISLTRGLDNPKDKQQVEIFVPDGQVVDLQTQAPGIWWQLTLKVNALGDLVKVLQSDDKNPFYQLANQQNNSLPDLTGLVRSTKNDNGSYGFTATGSWQMSAQEINQAGAQVTAHAHLQGYLAGDIENDPFTTALGSSSNLQGELRALLQVTGGNQNQQWKLQAKLNGQLTTLSQHTLNNGLVERQVQVDAHLLLNFNASESKPIPFTVRFNIQRKINSLAGSFIVDDINHAASSSPLYLDWQDDPSHAVFYTITTALNNAITSSFLYRKFDHNSKAAEEKVASYKTAADATSTSENIISQKQPIIVLDAYPDMPALNSATGVAAMTLIAQLADASDDTGFLARARRRMFPSYDAPAKQQINAQHDWLMFRRARTHLCAPTVSRTPASILEAFHIWHVKLKSAEHLTMLQQALTSNDAKLMEHFEFKIDGILRYRDENTQSEETANQILQMWQYAQPASQVALGRVWENTPTTGQGWQNHMRLRNMLEQITSLTQPPTRGDGSLSVLQQAPAPLGNNALDGGMLIATLPANTRKALVVYCYADGDNHYIGNDETSSWQTFTFINNSPQGTTLQDFISKLPITQSINYLTLATLTQPDSDAETRLKTVAAAITNANRPSPRMQNVTQLNQHDHNHLAEKAQPVEGYDEVVFMSANG